MAYVGSFRGEYYTTGQVARLLGMSAGAVAKQIDAGAIPGRRHPGSRYRRVRRMELLEWATEHDDLTEPVLARMRALAREEGGGG